MQRNKRRKNLYASQSNLIFKCYINECDYSVNQYNDLLLHIKEHLEEMVNSGEDGTVHILINGIKIITFFFR